MIKSKDILNEAMSDAEIKKMHKKAKETGELPPHLKKLLKGKKDFEKKFKVKNIVVPGLEWMADIDEAKTASIDGEELMNFLMKRFKMSKKKAIDTMKKHKMDTSFIKEARTINVEPNWEGMWRFFKQMAITNPRDWKRMERTLGSDWKKIDAMAKKNKWTESVNEAKTTSIDGTKLMNFLMKRFKFSKKKAIDTMKKAGMDTSFIKEAMGNTVVIDRKYIPKIAHVRKVLKLKMGKDLSVYKTDSNNVYHKVSDSQIKRFLDRLDRFDVKYKLGESVNEAIEPSGIMAKINKIVQDKQAAKIDGVLMDMFSASIMMRIFNAVNDKSKKDMNKGTMRQVKVILHKVMKQNKVRK